LAITDWNTVTISFFTHALNGLSINDFIVAAHSDLVPIEYSKKWQATEATLRAGLASQSAPVPASAADLATEK
jgi:hypothetical protein